MIPIIPDSYWWNRLHETDLNNQQAEQNPYIWQAEGCAQNAMIGEEQKQETVEERNERIWKAVQEFS
jgi:hypothetical protein